MRRFRDAAQNGEVKAAAFLMDRAERYRSSHAETTQAPELSPQDIEILESVLARDTRARKGARHGGSPPHGGRRERESTMRRKPS